MLAAPFHLFINTPHNPTLILSKRELEILQLAANGLSSKQIANQLNLSSHTIDTHNRNVVSKLQATSMKHAIAIGFRRGIIE